MEPKKPQKPLSNEQAWGIPDEDMPEVEDDQMIEDILADEMEAEERATMAANFENKCPYCLEPMDTCVCFEEEWGDDVGGNDLHLYDTPAGGGDQ